VICEFCHVELWGWARIGVNDIKERHGHAHDNLLVDTTKGMPCPFLYIKI